MSQRKEKLTDQIMSHVSESTAKAIRALAEIEGTDSSKYVRNLIESHVESKRKAYDDLSRIFLDNK